MHQQSSHGKEALLVDLMVGDRFTFDGHDYTVAEPPQSIWGLVEVWTEELDWAFERSETSSVYRLSCPPGERSRATAPTPAARAS